MEVTTLNDQVRAELHDLDRQATTLLEELAHQRAGCPDLIRELTARAETLWFGVQRLMIV